MSIDPDLEREYSPSSRVGGSSEPYIRDYREALTTFMEGQASLAALVPADDLARLRSLATADTSLVLAAGAPDAVQRRLNSELVATFREPKFAEYLASQALASIVSGPEEFAAFMKKDRETTAAVVKKFNIPRQ